MSNSGIYGTIMNTIHKEEQRTVMEQAKIDRINALAKKKRTVGLTGEELAEQKALHREYIASYRASLRGILDNTVIERPDGSREQLKKTSDNT